MSTIFAILYWGPLTMFFSSIDMISCKSQFHRVCCYYTLIPNTIFKFLFLSFFRFSCYTCFSLVLTFHLVTFICIYMLSLSFLLLCCILNNLKLSVLSFLLLLTLQCNTTILLFFFISILVFRCFFCLYCL